MKSNVGVLLCCWCFWPAVAIGGELYVTSFRESTLTKIDTTDGAVEYSIPHGSRGTIDVINGPNASLYVSRFWTNDIVQVEPQSGTATEVFAAGGGLDAATGIAFGPDGYLYVASRDSDAIKRYDGQTGEFVGDFASISDPEDLLFNTAGNLLVTQFSGSRVLEYDVRTGSRSVFTESPLLSYTRQMANGPDGMLYVAARETDNVVRFDGTTGEFVDEFLTGIDGANGLAFDELGNLFVGAEWGNAVYQYAPDGGLLQIFAVEGPIGILYVPEPSSIHLVWFAVTILRLRSKRRQ